MDPRRRITETLRELRATGEGARADELMPLVYDELRRLARRWFDARPPNASLQPTALVHEAYLHLVDQTSADWRDRAHFHAVAALAMRQILIQRARRRATLKRGGDRERVTLSGRGQDPMRGIEDLLALDEALRELSALHERQARVVELRFFGGLDVKEAAEVLGVSARTVEGDWRAARAWLRGALSRP